MFEIARHINLGQFIQSFGYRKDILKAFLDFLPHDYRWHVLNSYLFGSRKYAIANLWPNGARRGLPEKTRYAIDEYFKKQRTKN